MYCILRPQNIRGLAALLGLATAAALAQPSGFTYQGRLKQNGAPADGTYNMAFCLFSDPVGGTRLQCLPQDNDSYPVDVVNGLFTRVLPFDTAHFNGQSLYLEIHVSGGALSPRQEITPAPYAMYAYRAALADGSVTTAKIADGAVTPVKVGTAGGVAGQVLKVVSTGVAWAPDATLSLPIAETVSTDGNALEISNTGTGVGLRSTCTGSGPALWGESTKTVGSGYGVFAISHSTEGLALSASCTATTGFNWAVMGSNSSTNGTGVRGNADAISGTNYGVYGLSRSPNGYGVYGENIGGGDAGYFAGHVGVSAAGVGGNTMDISNTGAGGGLSSTCAGAGAAIYAESTRNSGSGFGILSVSRSPDSYAIYASSFATTGVNTVVTGVNLSTSGTGVRDSAEATSGTTYGVYGFSRSPNGYGVYGENTGGGYAAHFAGNVRVNGTLCTTSGTVSSCSDARFKTNVEPLCGALEAVMQMRGVMTCPRFMYQSL